MKTMQIEIAIDGGSRLVDAEVFGAWAVHISPGLYTHGRGRPKPARVITHVPTGMRAAHPMLVGVSKRVARKVAVRLNTAFPVLPDDVGPVGRGEGELCEASKKFMKRLSDAIFEFTIQAEKAK